jgi:hypothetical protein
LRVSPREQSASTVQTLGRDEDAAADAVEGFIGQKFLSVSS